jgi:hypothetical protein
MRSQSDRKNDEGRDPDGEVGNERPLPDEDEAKNDERDIDEGVAKEENVQDAARIIAEGAQEIAERGILRLEALDLVALEREEGGLEAGKKSRAEN